MFSVSINVVIDKAEYFVSFIKKVLQSIVVPAKRIARFPFGGHCSVLLFLNERLEAPSRRSLQLDGNGVVLPTVDAIDITATF